MRNANAIWYNVYNTHATTTKKTQKVTKKQHSHTQRKKTQISNYVESHWTESFGKFKLNFLLANFMMENSKLPHETKKNTRIKKLMNKKKW